MALAAIAIFMIISMNGKAYATEVPYYSLTNNYDYILTDNTAEVTTLLSDSYWYINSPSCSIFTSQSDYSGLVPLYRLTCTGTGSQYLTTTSSAMTTLESNGWTYYGIAGYVLPSTATMPSGWGPMYVALNSSTSVYLFTADMTEWNSIGSGWNKYSAVICWVPNPGS